MQMRVRTFLVGMSVGTYVRMWLVVLTPLTQYVVSKVGRKVRHKVRRKGGRVTAVRRIVRSEAG
eukprot:4561616-Ditylum_brightwellii.AAC.1